MTGRVMLQSLIRIFAHINIMINLITAILTFFRNCISSCVSLLKVAIKSRSVKIPIAGKDTCVVLGNGTSLTPVLEKNPAFLDDKEVFCVNSFASTELYEQVRPACYFILDPGYWHYQGEKDNRIGKMMDDMVTKTTWPLKLFMPQGARRSKLLMQLQERNRNIKIVFFNYTPVKGFRWLEHWLFRYNMGMPQSQNVMVAAVFMSINMKYKTTYILGAEHNWLVNLHVGDDNIVYIKYGHFYEDPSKVSYSKFFVDDTRKETFSIQKALYTFAKIFYGYERVRKYADAMGTKVYNATPGSFIDAFDRIKL